MFKEMQNLYEVRKSVRFELIPQFKKTHTTSSINNFEDDLKKFILGYEKLIGNFSSIVFGFNKENLNKKLKIKFSFLKTFTKRQYYENNLEKLKKGSNQIELGNTSKLGFLFEQFENLEKNNYFFLENIKELSSRGFENKARKSDMAYFFHQISKKTNFEFIKELFNDNINVENTDISKKIQTTKDLLGDIETLIRRIEKYLLPSQSLGQVIEKSSFNYYTVNKKPKDYNKKIQEKIHDKSKILKDFYPILNIEDSGFKQYIKKLDITEKPTHLKIEEAYSLMKEYKAIQKSNFLEFLGKVVKGDEKISKAPLFDDIFKEKNKQIYKEILDLTKAISLLSQTKTDILNLKDVSDKDEREKEIDANLKKYNDDFGKVFGEIEKNNFFEKITELKKERGQYFFEGNTEGKFIFKKYGRFCYEYKKIAMQYGKIKAHIKSLEKEKIDAQKTDSWALIIERDNNKFLTTIPRKKCFYAKKYIDLLPSDKNGEYYLYKFESLTLKALEKLCFGKENNTFRPTLYSNITEKKFLNNKNKLKQKFEFIKEVDGKNIHDERLLLDFYIKVLSLDSTKRQIALSFYQGFDEFIKKDFENLDIFEEELKKVCYIKQKIPISEEIKNHITYSFQANIYKITSYDLKKHDKSEIEKLKNKSEFDRKKPKKHTELWWSFWTDDNEKNTYPIRVNPEIKISFIEKDESFIKKSSNLPFNRKFHDRYILTTSCSQNALKKSIDLNFKETSEILDFYRNYNEVFNRENKPSLHYSYGIDRGETELASLGIFNIGEHKVEEKGVKIKVYELKEEYFKATDAKGRSAYKNISYFTGEQYKDYFEEKEVSCIDMSVAKLISGKIFTNGDISTYLNTKMVSAKRKIYEYISRKKYVDEEIKICEYGIIKLVSQIKEETELQKQGKKQKARKYIYKFDEKYTSIVSLEDIVQELEKYLKKVKLDLNDNENISIKKVNNLRDAISGNIVGIITFLQKKYPGMIYLEDIIIKDRKDMFEKNNSTLGSRIEQKLLQKFVSNNQVPPNYKQFFILHDKKDIDQLGIIEYVKKEGTSGNCPHCGKKLFGHGRGPNFENSMHHYKENNKVNYGEYLEEAKKSENNNCDYHMKDKPKGFSFIKSGDDLATYNIAEKAKEYLEGFK